MTAVTTRGTTSFITEYDFSRAGQGTSEDAMAAGSKAADFKRILLNKCQKEFETKHECVRAGCASAILVVCLAHVWVRVCCSCLVVLRRQDG